MANVGQSGKKLTKRLARQKVDFRHLSRMVAFCQLCVATVFLVALILMFFITFVFTMTAQENPEAISHRFEEMPKYIQNAFVFSIWFGFAGLALETFFQFWSSFRLLRATEIGSSTTQALECTRFWRNVTMIFTFLDATVLGLGRHTEVLVVAFLCIRVAYLWVVAVFTAELEKKKQKSLLKAERAVEMECYYYYYDNPIDISV